MYESYFYVIPDIRQGTKQLMLSSEGSEIATSDGELLKNRNLGLPWRTSTGASIGSPRLMHTKKPTISQDRTQFLK